MNKKRFALSSREEDEEKQCDGNNGLEIEMFMVCLPYSLC